MRFVHIADIHLATGSKPERTLSDFRKAFENAIRYAIDKRRISFSSPGLFHSATVEHKHTWMPLSFGLAKDEGIP